MQDELITKLQSGDLEAFETLVETYQRYLYQTVYAILRNEKDAEDALQEAFLKIYYALPQYEERGLKTWMSRIAVNHAIDVRRKKMRQKEDAMQDFAIEQTPHQDNVEWTVMRNDQRQRIKDRLAQLPSNYQDVIRAYYIEEKTYKEIAAEQHLEVKTVEMKLYRARGWMKKHWKEDDF